MQKTDVEAIMKEIRKNISDRKYSEKEADFASAMGRRKECNENLFREKHSYMQTNYYNPVYFPLEGRRVKTLMQRIIRRLLRFVNFSAFQFQNRFNEAAFVCVDEMNKKLKLLEQQNRMQQKRLNQMEQEIYILGKKNR